MILLYFLVENFVFEYLTEIPNYLALAFAVLSESVLNAELTIRCHVNEVRALFLLT